MDTKEGEEDASKDLKYPGTLAMMDDYAEDDDDGF
jgi:hypothetical protein